MFQGFQVSFRRLVKRSPRACLLAYAFSLPPKIIDRDFQNPSVLDDLPTWSASSISQISVTALLHGAGDLISGRFETLSPDGEKVWSWPQGLRVEQAPFQRISTEKERARLLKRAASAHSFLISGESLGFKPDSRMEGNLWSVPMGSELDGLGLLSSSSTLTTWSSYPPRLGLLTSNRLSLHRYFWPVEGEPVVFRPCAGRESVLVENVRRGIVRLVHFRDTEPTHVGIFDFSDGKRTSAATGAFVKSCTDFWLVGSFGVVHLEMERPD
jgi:hypothetical protein